MHVDAVIVGGGLVGASLACALEGLRVAIIDAPLAAPTTGPFDSRVYAVSPGNAAFLDRLGAWGRLPPGAATPVHAMSVTGDDGESRLAFDAWDCGVSELAWIVEERVLLEALHAVLRERTGLERIAPARGVALRVAPEAVELDLDVGIRIVAKLVVGADGARSFVRDAAGIGVREREYGHAAVVANFACERDHRGVAHQWFRGGPVLALLPMRDGHASMVWSTSAAEAERLAALAPASLAAEVERESRGTLGALEVVTPARVFPLRRIGAAAMAAERVALAGDAAHVVHPLAGQGVNLGFGDVRALAGVIASREPSRDIGEHALLRRYERSRAEAILAMDATVDGLFRLFGAQAPAVRRLRNAGMELVDRVGVLKNLLIRHAMQ